MSSPSTVLIVDDEPRNRALLEAILRPLGYTIASAVDGQEALEKTLELRPDIILLDVMMPDITGYEVCETIRQDPDLAEIPVLLVTALDDRESRLRGIDAGADDFLTKPVDAVEIQARVKTVTRLNRYRRLVAEREKFLTIADFASDALLLLDQKSRVQYANARARHLLDLNENSGGSTPFIELAAARFELHPAEAWKQWGDEGPPADQLLRYLVSHAGERGATWLQARVFKLPATGGADWLVRLQDVTGLMGQRREQWGFQRMLSHKMRTPLNGLIGSLESLTSEDEVNAGSALADSLQDAIQSARRLESQVKDVLLYLDAAKLSRLGDPMPVRRLGTRAVDVARRLGLVDPRVTTEPGCVESSLALGDNAMELVFAELFENSQKFHPSLSPVIQVKVASVGECIEVVVADDGEALSMDVLKQVATPYFQGEPGMTGELPGMGLGLAMVSQMLWEVGGQVKIANGPAGGVAVTLQIPKSA